MSRHFQHVPTRPVHYLLKPLWGLSYFDLKKEKSQKEGLVYEKGQKRDVFKISWFEGRMLILEV